ncbi:hypothetical protein BV25DRAFT_1833529, partial [Artomyces pyxidatus]
VSLPEKLSEFSPSASDVRINVFWFMSLIFSLGAALAATIVQQWVRDYMHVFQRYNNSLKRARLRQYLYEGAELWKMSIIVEGVPALIHVSLFLFFIGLSDFLFHLDRIVAILVTIMISGCGLLYIGTMIAPVLYAQSPYQTPISGIFWWIFQSFGGRYHSDKSTGGERRPVSTDLTDGRVQLAMDESDERRKRDARAICWVIDNLTEDSELEPFVAGIPGSLNTSWGKEVWETVAKDQASPNVSAGHHPRDFWKFGRSQLVSSSMVHSHNAVTDFSGRITRLLKTCTDPGILIEKDRRRRARACVDAALSFVLNMDGKWEWFAEGEILADALNYLGGVEKIRLWPERPEDFDNAFATRWTCMTLMTTRTLVQRESVQDAARSAIAKLAEARAENDEPTDDVAARTAGILDKFINKAWSSAEKIYTRLSKDEPPEELLRQVLDDGRWDVMDLEYSWNVMGWADETDMVVLDLLQALMDSTGGVLAHIPGVAMPWPAETRRAAAGAQDMPHWLMPQLLPARLLIQRLWICTRGLRHLEATGWGTTPNQPANLVDLCATELRLPPLQKLMSSVAFKTQLYRIQDLRDGGMAYTLELLVIAIRASRQNSLESWRDMYVGTIKTITADWESCRTSLGTQKCLVALLRDILPVKMSTLPDALPSFIVDEILVVVGNILLGTKGSHVKEAISLIKEHLDIFPSHEMAIKALEKLRTG